MPLERWRHSKTVPEFRMAVSSIDPFLIGNASAVSAAAPSSDGDNDRIDLRETFQSTISSSSKSSSYYTMGSKALDGLSKFHNSILSRGVSRQRFVTGRYPLTVTVTENPTRKWLAAAETEILVNGTSPARGLASLDRFHWLDDAERKCLLESYAMVSLELLAEIHTERPGYLQILQGQGAGSLARTLQERQNGDHDAQKFMSSHELSGSVPFESLSGGSSFIEKRPLAWQNNPWKRATAMLAERIQNKYSDTEQDSDRLWVTGFSLAGRQGVVQSIECDSGLMKSVSARTSNSILWPNEVQSIPYQLIEQNGFVAANSSNGTFNVGSDRMTPVIPAGPQRHQDALLVCDGFLVPGKDRGGLYVIKNPGNPEFEWTVRVTPNNGSARVTTTRKAASSRFASTKTRKASSIATSVATTSSGSDRWFYHRAVWLDLTGDGRQSILTARCKVSTVLDRDQDIRITSGIMKSGELVWLECPLPPLVDVETGTALDYDGTVFDPLSSRHTPWKAHVLASGPDVMFSIADLDPQDDTIEVIASEFFRKRVSLYSIQRGPRPEVTFSRSIDEHCGAAFSSILADLENDERSSRSRPIVINSGSTVPSLKPGDEFSHLLVTSHECSYSESEKTEADGLSTTNGQTASTVPVSTARDIEGGSLFAYRVPKGKGEWKTKPWVRSTVATGFKVKSKLGNMINPGAPGFVYTFHARKEDRKRTKRPFIAIAGDCAESAYILRPADYDRISGGARLIDPKTQYELMVEIDCGATVGSIGVGYEDFSTAEQESGYAKLYIPCYEKDKILVFGLGSGEDDFDDGW